jgi:hypothetical protein
MKVRAAFWVVTSVGILTACSQPGAITPPASTVANAARGDRAAYKIYVANIGDATIATYLPDGTQTAPTIAVGENYLYSVAVAPNGKIYALTFDGLLGPHTNGTITSYDPDGTPTTPTITVKELGYHVSTAMAVDARGKIYVLSSVHDGTRGKVTTYKPDGTPTKLSFRTGRDSSGIAIDGNGKIYVANDAGPPGKSSITTYLSDGTPTTPTITRAVHQPIAMAVAPDGTIYVANTTSHGRDGTGAGYVTSYSADGKGPLQRFTFRRVAPGGIALADGNLYVASSSAYTSILETFALDGSRISPTITAGLYEPSAIAIH